MIFRLTRLLRCFFFISILVTGMSVIAAFLLLKSDAHAFTVRYSLDKKKQNLNLRSFLEFFTQMQPSSSIKSTLSTSSIQVKRPRLQSDPRNLQSSHRNSKDRSMMAPSNGYNSSPLSMTTEQDSASKLVFASSSSGNWPPHQLNASSSPKLRKPCLPSWPCFSGSA